MSRPKEFETAIHVRLLEGQKARIDALRGKAPQASFLRDLIEEGLQRREEASDRPASKKVD